MTENDFHTIKVPKRSWYEWVLWALWLGVLVFLLQNAIASGTELARQAATIFWIMFGVTLVGGVVVWVLRR